MQTNPKTAKIIFSAYAAVLFILFFLWHHFDNIVLLVSFELLLILLCLWVFIQAKYFLSLLKRSASIKNIEIILIKVLPILLIISSCLIIYANVLSSCVE